MRGVERITAAVRIFSYGRVIQTGRPVQSGVRFSLGETI
jgi:hypothetical protein